MATLDELIAQDGKQGAVPTVEAAAPTMTLDEMLQQAELAKAGDASAAIGGSIVNGVPIVGPYLKEGLDATAAGIRSLQSGQPYAVERQNVQDFSNATMATHPTAAKAGEIGGAIAGTLPVMALAPAAFGVGLSTLPGMAAGGATGALISGADAKARGESWGDAGRAAAVGGALGAAGAPIAKVGGALLQMLGRSPEALEGMSRAGRQKLTELIGAPAEQQQLLSDMRQLSPEAMPLDVSPKWEGLARGSAAASGERNLVVNALMQRDAGAVNRLEAARRGLGPDVPEFRINQDIASNVDTVAPMYRSVLREANAVDTAPLANRLDTRIVDTAGDTKSTLQRVRSMLNLHGTDQLDPSPLKLFEVRQEIRGMADEARARGNSTLADELDNTRQWVSDHLAENVPEINRLDTMSAELGRQERAVEGARGLMARGTGPDVVHPDQLVENLTRQAQPTGGDLNPLNGPSAEPFRQRQAVTALLDQVAGNDPADALALQRFVGGEGDWARQKLGTLYGDRAQPFLDTVDAETRMRLKSGRVRTGSDTAMTEQARRELNQIADPGAMPELVSPGTTGMGLVLSALKRMGSAGASKIAENRAAGITRDVARLSVSRADEAEAIMRQLTAQAARNQAGQQFAGAAVAGARAPALSALPNDMGGTQLVINALLQRLGLGATSQ